MNLLPHQENSISHLQNWVVGALFMEAGTGKTRVACELIKSVKNVDAVLWVAPLRTIKPKDGINSICEEIKKWDVPFPIKYVGVESISASDRIYLETLDFVKSASNPFIVVDESLKIKNIEAKRTKRLLFIGSNAKYKLILNGTPLSKNLLDLWSQMEFLSPKILDMSYTQFKNTFCDYTTVTKWDRGRKIVREWINGYENIDYLYSLIRNYVFQCDLHLNVSQNFTEIKYCLNEVETEEYYSIKGYFLDVLKDGANGNLFLEMTQKMQHSYCCAEAKFDAVEELFKHIEQSKTIIFCKYIDSRVACEARFPNAQVLSYQKESLGLNLQQYNHTIYFDKIWDLSLRVQSSHRTFRTGQEYNCFYYDLTGNVGLENLIDQNISKKVSMLEYFKKTTIEDLKERL